MINYRMSRSVKAKLAALGAIGVCVATVAPPSALALNPQPLPPRSALQVVNPPGLIGGLTCHEYGCM